ncbi:MAG TPA: serine/threonine-protein kinase [Ornithinibacter sp.]|nr:serine/threonine-protein kinase [Ornithinibacter sp.]
MDDEGTQPPEVPGFEVGELLARGGTSEVWAGVAVPEGRRVAIKVVQAGLGEVEAAAREAAVSAAAASAHIVEIHSVIDLADGRVALVMPHLRGGSLDALVRTRGHLTAGEVVTALAPVASALGRLHGLGVVHGDVSPGNVLLDLDGRPVLGDLGLGHVVGDISPGVWGTDGYVAPEVVMGGDPSPASDVYGVGALGWLCLTGSVPGAPGLRPALADVSRAGPSAAGLVEALEAALSPDPADRPDAHELGWLLFQAATATPLDLVRGGDEVSAVTYRLRAAAGEAPALEATPRWRRVWARLAGRGAAPPTSIPVERRRGAGRHSEPATRAGVGVARVAVTAAGAAALAVALVVAATVLGRDSGSAEARAAPSTVQPVGGPAQVRPTFVPDPRVDPVSPRERPQELLTALAEARAGAFREATPAMLHGAVAPGSTAAARDAAAVSEVARAGLRYSGLRYDVVDARHVSGDARAAVVQARIDASAYSVVGRSGAQPQPAQEGRVVVVDLVFTQAGWRISAIRPVS